MFKSILLWQIILDKLIRKCLDIMFLRVSMYYGLGHGTIVSWIRQGLDTLKIMAKTLKVVSSNQAFTLSSQKRIVDNAILAFKIQQND